MKRYIKSTQSIFAGYSCNGWFNILKNQKIPVSSYDDLDYYERKEIEHFDDDEWSWGNSVRYRTDPEYVDGGYQCIIDYTGGWDHDVNNHLRGKKYNNDRGWTKYTTRQHANRMHKVISNAVLPKDIVTIRWADIDNLVAYLGKQAPENIQKGNIETYIGKIVKERGFYSSSMCGDITHHDYYKTKQVQFITLLPKGSPAIYVWEHVTRHPREFEIILTNGSSFIIRDIQYSENGFDASSGLESGAKYRVFMEKV